MTKRSRFIRSLLVLFVSAIMTLATAADASADRVSLANGDRISGQIIHISDGKIQIETEYAGAVTVDLGKVKDLRIEGPGRISLTNGDLITGKINALSPDHVEIESRSLGTLKMPRAEFAEFQPGEAPPPDEAAKAPEEARVEEKWSGSFGVGAQLQRGNTETTDVRVEAKATRKAPREELHLRFYSDYGETEGETDTNKVFGQIKLKVFQTERRYIFGVVDMEYDEMESLDLRAQAFGGLGYKFIDKERTQLLGEIGGGLTGEFFDDVTGDEETLEASLYLSGEWTRRLLEKLIFYEGLTLFPSLGDVGEFRLRSESTLISPLGKGWALKLSLIDDYDSDPEAEDAENNDLRFISSVVYTF